MFAAAPPWKALPLLLLLPLPLAAQLPAPSISFLFPPGGAAGSEVEVKLFGSELDDVDELRFSHRGITAHPKDGPMKDGPVFRVRIGERVPSGVHAAQAIGRWGASAPRAFHVDRLGELSEKEPNGSPAAGQEVPIESTVSGAMAENVDQDCFRVKLARGDRVFIDCWARRLDARWDPTLRLLDPSGGEAASNRDFFGEDPFIDYTAQLDGEHTVVLHDFLYGGGPERIYRLRITKGPHLDFAVPAAVPRVIEDLERPAVAPSGGKQRGEIVKLIGRGLPGGRPAGHHWLDGRPLDSIEVSVRPPRELPGFRLRFGGSDSPAVSGVALFDVSHGEGACRTNAVPIGIAEAPVILEEEPNDPALEGGRAQPVSIPFDVTGQFSGPRDIDGYELDARKGEALWIETIARRMGSEADPALTIERIEKTEKTGKAGEAGKEASVLRELDDDGEKLLEDRFDTRSFDPRALWTAPEDGRYRLSVRDSSRHKTAPREDAQGLFYRLVCRQARPDFELILLSSSGGTRGALSVPRGGRGYLEVHVIRREGYTGPLRVDATGLPLGLDCPGAYLGPSAAFAPLVFQAGPDAPQAAEPIQVYGHGEVDGRRAVRPARPYALHLAGNTNLVRPIDEALAGVDSGPVPFVLEAEPARLIARPGSKAALKVKLTREAPFDGAVQVATLSRVSGLKNASAAIEKDKSEAALEIELEGGVLPGRYTLALRGEAEAPFTKAPGEKPRKFKARTPSQPITLDVIAPPFEIRIVEGGGKIAAGGTLRVGIEIERRFGFQGEVGLALVRPEDSGWLSAADAGVPRKVRRATIELRAAADARPGKLDGVAVRGSATFLGQPVARDVKLPLEVEEPVAGPGREL